MGEPPGAEPRGKSVGQRYIDKALNRSLTNGDVVLSPGDKTSFDYRASVSAVVGALVSIHAMGGGQRPNIDTQNRRVTITPDWVKEYVVLASITADLEPVAVGTTAVTRVRWSTHSNSPPSTVEEAAEDGHRAAERVNNILAHLLRSRVASEDGGD